MVVAMDMGGPAGQLDVVAQGGPPSSQALGPFLARGVAPEEEGTPPCLPLVVDTGLRGQAQVGHKHHHNPLGWHKDHPSSHAPDL